MTFAGKVTRLTPTGFLAAVGVPVIKRSKANGPRYSVRAVPHTVRWHGPVPRVGSRVVIEGVATGQTITASSVRKANPRTTPEPTVHQPFAGTEIGTKRARTKRGSPGPRWRINKITNASFKHAKSLGLLARVVPLPDGRWEWTAFDRRGPKNVVAGQSIVEEEGDGKRAADAVLKRLRLAKKTALVAKE